MAGNELVTEGFQAGQVGSSAMPHKMNTRSCERVNGLAVVVRGSVAMLGELAGDQWNEGDVSDSVVRRVALPDAFLATDGLFETLLTVLDEFGVFPAVVARELDRYLPFLATTKVLMHAVRHGVGREQAHAAVKEHAVAVALAMREQGAERNDLLDRLAADQRLGLSRDALAEAVASPLSFTGAASDQVDAVVASVEALATGHRGRLGTCRARSSSSAHAPCSRAAERRRASGRGRGVEEFEQPRARRAALTARPATGAGGPRPVGPWPACASPTSTPTRSCTRRRVDVRVRPGNAAAARGRPRPARRRPGQPGHGRAAGRGVAGAGRR